MFHLSNNFIFEIVIMTFACHKCNKQFSSNRDLMRHLNGVRPCVKQILICEKCGYETTNNTSFKRHLERKSPCGINLLSIDKDAEIQKIYDRIDKLEKKIKQTKRPINYNFILANFNNTINIEDYLATENIKDAVQNCKKMHLKDGNTVF